ncbi:hypothetical protein ACTAB2_07245 [Pseudomonas syringae]|uniref:hypothetical protein n=1 Tax=Pseudomonas syringae TaxID=317 RepID=UPI003F7AFF18
MAVESIVQGQASRAGHARLGVVMLIEPRKRQTVFVEPAPFKATQSTHPETHVPPEGLLEIQDMAALASVAACSDWLLSADCVEKVCPSRLRMYGMLKMPFLRASTRNMNPEPSAPSKDFKLRRVLFCRGNHGPLFQQNQPIADLQGIYKISSDSDQTVTDAIACLTPDDSWMSLRRRIHDSTENFSLNDSFYSCGNTPADMLPSRLRRDIRINAISQHFYASSQTSTRGIIRGMKKAL